MDSSLPSIIHMSDGLDRYFFMDSIPSFPMFSRFNQQFVMDSPNLVGGFNHLEKYESQWLVDDIQYIMENKNHVPNHQPEIVIQAAHPIGQGQKHLPQKHLLGHLLGEPRSWMLSSSKKGFNMI